MLCTFTVNIDRSYLCIWWNTAERHLQLCISFSPRFKQFIFRSNIYAALCPLFRHYDVITSLSFACHNNQEEVEENTKKGRKEGRKEGNKDKRVWLMEIKWWKQRTRKRRGRKKYSEVRIVSIAYRKIGNWNLCISHELTNMKVIKYE